MSVGGTSVHFNYYQYLLESEKITRNCDTNQQFFFPNKAAF